MKRLARIPNSARKGTPGPLFRTMQRELNDHSNLVAEEKRWSEAHKAQQLEEQKRANEEAFRKEQEREKQRVTILTFPKESIGDDRANHA